MNFYTVLTLNYEKVPIIKNINIKNLHTQAKNILHWLVWAIFVDLPT